MVDSKLRELGEIVSSPENISKNPVSLLMEAAAQVKESASFHCIDELTLSNMKLFTCEVKIGRLLKCRGTGPNKKAAKASAAENALESMRTRAGLSGNSPRISQQVTPTLYSQQSSPAASFSPNTCFNPVGSLQEMCIKNNWSPPQYDLIREAGEAHSKTFIYECKVGSWVAQGQGKKKKDAKRLAAENLLSMITQGTPTNNKRKKQEKEKLEKRLRKSPQGAEAGPSRTPFRNFPDQDFGTVGASNSSTSLRTPLRSSSFLSSLLYDSVEDDEEEVASVGSAASSSPIEDISQEFCSSLEDKGKKSGFSVEYHDLSQKGYSGNYLCFVRLTTQPPAVCSGMGPTKTCAYEKAAKNALQYLSTVCS